MSTPAGFYSTYYIIHEHPALDGIICKKDCHKYYAGFLEYNHIEADPCACCGGIPKEDNKKRAKGGVKTKW